MRHKWLRYADGLELKLLVFKLKNDLTGLKSFLISGTIWPIHNLLTQAAWLVSCESVLSLANRTQPNRIFLVENYSKVGVTYVLLNQNKFVPRLLCIKSKKSKALRTNAQAQNDVTCSYKRLHIYIYYKRKWYVKYFRNTFDFFTSIKRNWFSRGLLRMDSYTRSGFHINFTCILYIPYSH